MLVGLMQKPAADFYAVKIYDSSAPELGQLADVYKGIEEQTKSQRFFALALAAIVGVAVFHLAGELIGRGLFFTSQRRTLVMDGLMFVCGPVRSIRRNSMYLGYASKASIHPSMST